MKNRTGIWRHQRDAGPVVVSVLLHLVVAGLILLFPPATYPEPPQEKPVIVDVFTPQQFQAIHRESARIKPSPGPSQPSVGSSTVRAKKILSSAALSEPDNAQARLALSRLRGNTRLEQLCSIEAMEQLSTWQPNMKPEWIVTSARSDTQTIDNTYVAKGAAFRHTDHWYDLSFTCETSPDLEEVVAFEFTVGNRIPHNQLERLRLFIGLDNHDHD